MHAIDTAPLSEPAGRGSAILLAGRRYLESHAGVDPFVTAIANDLGSEQAGYSILPSADQHGARA